MESKDQDDLDCHWYTYHSTYAYVNMREWREKSGMHHKQELNLYSNSHSPDQQLLKPLNNHENLDYFLQHQRISVQLEKLTHNTFVQSNVRSRLLFLNLYWIFVTTEKIRRKTKTRFIIMLRKTLNSFYPDISVTSPPSTTPFSSFNMTAILVSPMSF